MSRNGFAISSLHSRALARELTVVMPLHPRTRKALGSAALAPVPNLLLMEPVSYLDMLLLESEARVILTDSGGVQKEAYFFRVPCVTLRDETEWVETVHTGWNTIVGTRMDAILNAGLEPKPGDTDSRPFGTGDASEKICEILIRS